MARGLRRCSRMSARYTPARSPAPTDGVVAGAPADKEAVDDTVLEVDDPDEGVVVETDEDHDKAE